MRMLKKSWFWMPFVAVVIAVSSQMGFAQPPSKPPESATVARPVQKSVPKIGDVSVDVVLQKLGAKQEQEVTVKTLDDYTNHFNRTDPNGDGKHTKEEYVDNGGYMTPQARAGIFRAADGNADGVVTRAEYVLNRIITDEAKRIVQGMDDDKDGAVQQAEFVKHATNRFANPELAEQIYGEFDANDDGVITIPEYLRVWGQWARAGKKPAEERLAARRAQIDKSTKESDEKSVIPKAGRPDDSPAGGRPLQSIRSGPLQPKAN